MMQDEKRVDMLEGTTTDASNVGGREGCEKCEGDVYRYEKMIWMGVGSEKRCYYCSL